MAAEPDNAASLYLRPVGLATAEALEPTIAEGRALPLAGGPLAFQSLQVIQRSSNGRIYKTVSVESLQDQPRDGPVQRRIRRLSAPRPFARTPLIMGVVNVTPDSFSDPGEQLDPERAVARAEQLAADGAAIIDIGGESTRPGAQPVAPAVERQRIAPVFERLAARSDLLLSIDTQRASTMTAALERGAGMINDVSALTGDPNSLSVAAASPAWVVLMHKQGEPATMNQAPRYRDVALDVFDYLEARVDAAVAAGIKRSRLIVDPGIGFGKKSKHNLAIMSQLSLFHGLGCPLLLGVSRKGLSGAFERARPPKQRLAGSLAAALHGLGQGVQILRVHDVAETRQALQVWHAIGHGHEPERKIGSD